MRTEDEIRAELERMKGRLRALRRARDSVEAAYCAVIIQTLAYVLSEAPSPAVRVKVK